MHRKPTSENAVNQTMTNDTAIRHLTVFEDNDRLEELKDRMPDDRIDFRLLYDGEVVSPWSKNPNEITRLYFNDDRLGDFYVPIDFPEQLEEETRSTPIGRPTTDDDQKSWGEVDDDYRIEQGTEIDGHEFDLLWYRQSEEDDENVIAAADFGENGR